jgi:hypothetical protein
VSSPGIVPPIVVSEDGDLDFFRSAADVTNYFEPWFPGAVDYRAYDSEGRALELYADPPVVARWWLFGLIGTDNAHESQLFVRTREVEPSHRDELTDVLRDWLRRTAPEEARLEAKTCEELLDRAIQGNGFT